MLIFNVSSSAAGDDFDIREFHEEILHLGPVPIHVVELAVYQWIQAQAGQAAEAVAISNALMPIALVLSWSAVRLPA